MFFLFYRMTDWRDGSTGPWRARPDGFETEALADAHVAGVPDGHYAATMVRFIEGLR